MVPFKSRKISEIIWPFWCFESTSFWRSLLFIVERSYRMTMNKEWISPLIEEHVANRTKKRLARSDEEWRRYCRKEKYLFNLAHPICTRRAWHLINSAYVFNEVITGTLLFVNTSRVWLSQSCECSKASIMRTVLDILTSHPMWRYRTILTAPRPRADRSPSQKFPSKSYPQVTNNSALTWMTWMLTGLFCWTWESRIDWGIWVGWPDSVLHGMVIIALLSMIEIIFSFWK